MCTQVMVETLIFTYDYWQDLSDKTEGFLYLFDFHRRVIFDIHLKIL